MVRTNIGGWKHGYYATPDDIRDEVSCVVCHKEPYSWLVSCYDYLKLNEPFHKFLKNPLTMKGIVYKDNGKSPYVIRAASPIHYWNNMTLHWCGIKLQRGLGKQNSNHKNSVYHIRYEEVLRDPQKTLDQHFLQYRTVGGFNRPLQELKRNQDKHATSDMLSDKNFNKRRDYYLGNKYFKKYTPETLDYVNSQLDTNALREAGYGLIPRLPKLD